MVDNKQISNINKFLQKQLLQKFGVFAVALLVVGGVSYFGLHQNQASHAASIGILSMSTNTAGAVSTLTTGSNVSIVLSEDSGTDPVNAVQASVTFDATKLQYISTTEGTAFPTIAANSTATVGLVRIGRATSANSPVIGKNTIVTVTFKVIGTSGTTSLAYDPAFSFLVSSVSNVNILTSSTGASYAVQLPAPTITSLAPVSGPIAGGTTITITGSNFATGATVPSVTIGGTAATNVVVNASTSPTIMTMTATVPAHAAGAVAVVVTNPDGQTVSKTGGYTYLTSAPTITNIAPTSGTTAGGTTITISGTNFVTGALVKVASLTVPATTSTFVSATSMTAVMPAHAAGAVEIIVVNPDGQGANSSGSQHFYTYITPAPVISTVTPLSGPTTGGTNVTITGSNFVGITSVTIGGALTNFTVVNPTTITAITPFRTIAGAVDISITNSTGTATKTGGFSYIGPAPAVTAISPAAGTANGGTVVTITGTNFVSGAKVAFGTTNAAVVTFLNSTTLTATAPANAAGVVAVGVINPDAQKGSLITAYTYLGLGDANNDGRINAIDLSILISHDGQNYPPADFNGDGTVGAADMAILLGRWTW